MDRNGDKKKQQGKNATEEQYKHHQHHDPHGHFLAVFEPSCCPVSGALLARFRAIPYSISVRTSGSGFRAPFRARFLYVYFMCKTEMGTKSVDTFTRFGPHERSVVTVWGWGGRGGSILAALAAPRPDLHAPGRPGAHNYTFHLRAAKK